MPTLRERLLSRQTTDDLRRKADLSHERSRLWTQEEIDYAERQADELHKRLNVLTERTSET